MPSIFLGLEIAKRALAMSQLNLQVIAHNIANAGTEGYSRQRVELTTPPPLAYPSFTRPGYVQQIGSGVEMEAINRIRDEFLDEIIRQQTGAQGRNTTMQNVLRQIELIFNEPGENGLGSVIDNFFAAWQDLANNPELVSTRASLRESAVSLVRSITTIHNSLDQLADEQITQLRLKVIEVNNLARQIADLNIQVAQVKGLGDSPNDLMDQRDLLIEKLSEIIPVSTIRQENNTLSVLIGGLRIIENDTVNELELVGSPDDPSSIQILFKNKNNPNFAGKGVLAGHLEAYTSTIPLFHDRINTLTTALVNRVNLLHRQGFGLDGLSNRPFFEEHRTAIMEGTQKLDPDINENTRLDELGITAGYFTIQGKTINISTEDVAPGEGITIGELLDRINEDQPYVRAVLDYTILGEAYFRLDLYNPVSTDVEIQVLPGSSNFLSVTGLDNAESKFTYIAETYETSAAMLKLAASVTEDLNTIAAAGDDGSGTFSGPGNNQNALAIASLQSLTTGVGETTFNDYYSSFIGELGSMGQTVGRLTSNQAVLIDQLTVQRESIKGVNLDEEATKMITYQRIYEGAARVTQVVDSLLDTIINRTGA